MLILPQQPNTAGVDEAGVGPWAGPVVAAAAIITPQMATQLENLGINDSKKLTAKRREKIYDILQDLKDPTKGLDYSVGLASVEEIDALNIRNATHLAMQRALEGLVLTPQKVLIDGNHGPQGLSCPMETVVKGDQKVLPIALASVVAKVYRDQIMQELDAAFPQYGWASNAGYGTKIHQEALARYGVTQHHRTSYAPVRACLTTSAERAA